MSTTRGFFSSFKNGQKVILTSKDKAVAAGRQASKLAALTFCCGGSPFSDSFASLLHGHAHDRNINKQPAVQALMESASFKYQVPYCVPHVCLPSHIKIASKAHHSHSSISKTCGNSRQLVGKRDTSLLIKAPLFLTMANSCKRHSAA